MPKVIELMRRREQEILKAIIYLSEKTDSFTKPELLVIGGYALRAFIPFSRFTRDCDFALRKKNGWSIDELQAYLPDDFSIEHKEKRDMYGFMRCIKFIGYDKVRIKVSIDFMEGEIRGRTEKDAVVIDKAMLEEKLITSISVADKEVKIAVPSYPDYFIMKIVSCRASDVRDIASLIHENGIPNRLNQRIKQILPYPEIFNTKLEKIILEMQRKTFLDSWKGIFGTRKYRKEDVERVVDLLTELLQKS